MDVAYDHITDETFSSDRATTPTPPKPGATSTSTSKPTLNAEFQETFQAFSNSPWGAKLSGMWGNVVKQSEQYYEGARREVEEASQEARKGFTDLKDSIVNQPRESSADGERQEESQNSAAVDGSSSANTDHHKASTGPKQKRTESDIIGENEGLVSRLRSEAAKRLKDVEKAEDAADEALLRFGATVRNFLRDAVAIAPPAEGSDETEGKGHVLFESKDSTGKRVIHTTRFDAQLHVIHSTLDSFTRDPVSAEWPAFKDGFRIDDNTDQISKDMETYLGLRQAIEQLVPEKVNYADFWCRYYFLRLVIETREQKRRELLQGAANPSTEQEVAWDADSDSESESEQNPTTTSSIAKNNNTKDTSSTTTLTSHQMPPTVSITTPNNTINSASGSSTIRTSTDHPHSHPDDSSDTSYDLVSRANSRTTGSPRDEKDEHEDENIRPGLVEGEVAGDGRAQRTQVGNVRVEDTSDEEDWE